MTTSAAAVIFYTLKGDKHDILRKMYLFWRYLSIIQNSVHPKNYVALVPPRYEAKTNELINEELGIAYPITDGIPNMIPQEARVIQKDKDTLTTPTQE